MPSSSVSGNALIFVATMAWSTAGLFTRVVSTDAPTTLFWRSLVGGLCILFVYYVWQRKDDSQQLFRFSIGEYVIATVTAISMVVLITAFYYTTVANVYFVFGTMPLVTLLLSVVFLKDKVTTIAIIACILCVLGTAVVVWGSERNSDYFGVFLAFAMTFLTAAMTVAAKYFSSADMSKSTYLAGFLAALMVFPFMSFTGVSSHDYFWLCMYGATNVGLGFAVYLLGVTRTSVISAALIGLAQIPIAPVWTWVIYDEQVSVPTIVGGTIILLAAFVYLLTGRNPA